MEQLPSSDEPVEPRDPPPSSMPVPSPQDRENERIRRAIAERMEAEWVECATWALKAFGPGWLPSCRHMLFSKDDEERHRKTGEHISPAAVVYTVKHADGRKRHFTVIADGQVVEHASHEAGFGAMLLEPHPTRGFEHQGKWCRIHRYSLCFAPYELYTPRTAEQLAALRATREQKKAEREEQKWAEEHPLFAWAGIRRDG